MRAVMERALLEPLKRLAEQFALIVPAVIAAVIVVIAGFVFAYLVRRVMYRLLVALHFDRIVARGGLAGVIERTGIFRSASDCGARVVQGFIWLLTILVALDSTGTPAAEGLVVRFVNYVPNLVTAGLILLLGLVISRFLARSALLAAVNAQWAGARIVASGVHFLVIALAIAMALEELRIGRTVLLVSFAILFTGIVVAGAIAFGLGARDLARQWLHSKVGRGPAESEEVFRHF
jgi:mechanosensitive ion channel-like protein